MQNFWTVARSGDKENTATNHWYRRPGTTGRNPLQYSAHDATGDKVFPVRISEPSTPRFCSSHYTASSQLAEGSRRARDPSMARRSLAGDATAGAASRVRFAPTSNNLLVSSWDSGLRLYDADEGTLRVNAESEAALLDCCFEDESSAFACGSDGSVRRYDFHSGSQDTVGHHEDVLACIEFSLMTGQVMTGSLDKKLMLWDLKTRNVSPSGTIILDSDVASLSICGMYILAAVARNVYFYDMRNLTTPVNEKDCPLEYPIRCLHASPEWNAYVAGSVDGAVALKYLDRGTDRDLGYAFRCHPKSRNGRSNLVPVNCIAVHPCKKTFVTGDDEGCTIAWDAHSKKKLTEGERPPPDIH
ncbi:mitotic checkpoint protein BUB3.3-like isoform X2 [Miscanthus floridulus]|uniref:mitotic checkpoint protein BUB3.3-like isoform X2 n=1 Tax=Miscanthus floridulus TaxID=154761 RepID=UPI00345784F7